MMPGPRRWSKTRSAAPAFTWGHIGRESLTSGVRWMALPRSRIALARRTLNSPWGRRWLSRAYHDGTRRLTPGVAGVQAVRLRSFAVAQDGVLPYERRRW
jgi:hypothetical protein